MLANVGSVVFDAKFSAVDWKTVFDADHLVVVLLVNNPVAADYPEAPWLSNFVLSSDNATGWKQRPGNLEHYTKAHKYCYI